jgi:hypothetical protein
MCDAQRVLQLLLLLLLLLSPTFTKTKKNVKGAGVVWLLFCSCELVHLSFLFLRVCDSKVCLPPFAFAFAFECATVLRQKSSGKDYFAGSSIIDYLLGTFYFPGL